jgi:hypothetical protein
VAREKTVGYALLDLIVGSSYEPSYSYMSHWIYLLFNHLVHARSWDTRKRCSVVLLAL